MSENRKVSSAIAGRCCIVIGCIIFFVFLCRLNQIEKVPLLSTDGRTFEKAIVTEVIKDNLEDSGIRMGNQIVALKILSGDFRGEEVTVYSASGYLYGAACEKGLYVTAVVNESNGELVASVYDDKLGLCDFGSNIDPSAGVRERFAIPSDEYYIITEKTEWETIMYNKTARSV